MTGAHWVKGTQINMTAVHTRCSAAGRIYNDLHDFSKAVHSTADLWFIMDRTKQVIKGSYILSINFYNDVIPLYACPESMSIKHVSNGSLD